MLWAELSVWNSSVVVLTLSTPECDCIEDRAFKKDDCVEVRLLGQALIQSEWYPLRKGNLDIQRNTLETPDEDTARRQTSASQGESPGKKAKPAD